MSSTVTFRALIEREYLAKGFTQKGALAKVHTEAGISIGSAEAAFRGTKVQSETADALVAWARRVHKVELDGLALMRAPAKGQRGAA